MSEHPESSGHIHTTPLRSAPTWAVLERSLFDAIESAWRAFSERYCTPDGRIRGVLAFDSRDGVDDLYEPFFNWPAFYALGGSDEVLAASKRHWEGVTAQLTEAGMLTDEYENGYDWFHQGESLLFFYGICAADPSDEAFADRARRFAELYTDPSHGNYDPRHNIIRAPHNGALGPLAGLDPHPQPYAANNGEMRAYGLPLHHVPGIERWEDLEDPAKAAAMGEAMNRAAAGDVPVNLAATGLVANRWLYDGDPASAQWILRYVDGWRERAHANGGLLPDSVAPDGIVGGLHDGRWYGGHYGWGWPHGLHSVGMSSLIGGLNAALVSGDDSYLDTSRAVLDTVMEHAITATLDETPFSLKSSALAHLGAGASEPMTLVPYRYGKDGWFDYGPVPMDLTTWLWWWTRDGSDRARLERAVAGLPGDTNAVEPFRDKIEAGHEAPWIAFLGGSNPDYPERALAMALGQVARRVAVMDTELVDPATVHLHFWQRANPVVTEVLSQLITGTPQVLYNGGLPFAAVAYEDLDRARPGLPPDVAALVTTLEGERIDLELANLSSTRARRIRVRPSRFGQQHLTTVISRGERGGVYPAASTAYRDVPGEAIESVLQIDAECVDLEIPPFHRAALTLITAPTTATPHHVSAHAHDRDSTLVSVGAPERSHVQEDHR